MVGSVMSSIGKYSGYGANFILGTGSETIGKEVQAAYQARKTTGKGIAGSIFDGFSKGVTKSNQQVAETGFLKKLGNTFTSLPSEMGKGWTNADVANKGVLKKYLTKTGQFLKPLGKTMPFLFNALYLLSAIPSIMDRTQDEGAFAGIKEAGKTIGKMGLYALGAAVGAAFGGIGILGGTAVAGLASDFLFGKDYSVKKDEQRAKLMAMQKQAQAAKQNADGVGQNIDYAG
ncbi:MAG: hypothetical protein NC311_10815 [Muribaculaceae bacterium]|nr:hypothetical protein [Muribaculaceae bacterium]